MVGYEHGQQPFEFNARNVKGNFLWRKIIRGKKSPFSDKRFMYFVSCLKIKHFVLLCRTCG